MAVSANNGSSRQSETLFRADDVDDTLAFVPKSKIS